MIPAREGESQAAYLNEHGQCLLCVYLETELARTERLVAQNDSFAALTPFWAVWPFEVMVLPLVHQDNISRLTARQRADLADILVRLAVKYDNLFRTHFPYSMGAHQAPTDGLEHPEWHFHFHFFPPLLRSANIRKFMVGYELLAAPQRDLTPETSAEMLRNLPETLYRHRRGDT
jgi:UDPglucose--hexose-1-phosphate uridylyltransferase